MATAVTAAKTVVMAAETLMAVMAVAALPQLMVGVIVVATIAAEFPPAPHVHRG